MATYLHIVRELLYKIDWPSGRRLYILAFCARIGILCARYLYSVIELTLSPWDSGSRIESTPSSWDSGSRIDTLGGFHQRVSRRMLVIWPIRDTKVRWVYQLLDAEMTALGLEEVDTYVFHLQNNTTQYIETSPILELCLTAE